MSLLWLQFLHMSSGLWKGVVNNKGFVALFLTIAILGGIWVSTTINHILEYRVDPASQVQGLHDQLQVVRNEKQDLEKLVDELMQDNVDLQQMISATGGRTETRYIQTIKTILVPEEPKAVFEILPPEYLHKYGPLVIASFQQVQGKYEFRTYELGVAITVVVGEDHSTAVTMIASSYDSTILEVPTDLQIIDVQKHRVLDPRLHLGLAASTDLHVYPYLGLSILSVKDMSFLAPGIGLDRAQVDAARLNIGKSLPLVDDLWIGAGANYSYQGTPGIQLTVSSNL